MTTVTTIPERGKVTLPVEFKVEWTHFDSRNSSVKATAYVLGVAICDSGNIGYRKEAHAIRAVRGKVREFAKREAAKVTKVGDLR